MFPWEMDVDGESSGALGQMEDLEKNSLENESCGICRDIIIDRGVLDCCSHWFCYTCIDNWAAITNRCPLCKSEFQHITCTPVYGTIGATDEDEYSLTSQTAYMGLPILHLKRDDTIDNTQKHNPVAKKVFPSRNSARTEEREGRCLRSPYRSRPCTRDRQLGFWGASTRLPESLLHRLLPGGEIGGLHLLRGGRTERSSSSSSA